MPGIDTHISPHMPPAGGLPVVPQAQQAPRTGSVRAGEESPRVSRTMALRPVQREQGPAETSPLSQPPDDRLNARGPVVAAPDTRVSLTLRSVADLLISLLRIREVRALGMASREFGEYLEMIPGHTRHDHLEAYARACVWSFQPKLCVDAVELDMMRKNLAARTAVLAENGGNAFAAALTMLAQHWETAQGRALDATEVNGLETWMRGHSNWLLHSPSLLRNHLRNNGTELQKIRRSIETAMDEVCACAMRQLQLHGPACVHLQPYADTPHVKHVRAQKGWEEDHVNPQPLLELGFAPEWHEVLQKIDDWNNRVDRGEAPCADELAARAGFRSMLGDERGPTRSLAARNLEISWMTVYVWAYAREAVARHDMRARAAVTQAGQTVPSAT